MSKSSMQFEDTVAAAADAKMAIKIPKDNELFLDLDTKPDYLHFLEIIGKLPDVKGWVKSPSKSGYPKCHVVVTMYRPVTSSERILLQACLGSDRLHELLSYLASRQGNSSPTVFFEKR